MHRPHHRASLNFLYLLKVRDKISYLIYLYCLVIIVSHRDKRIAVHLGSTAEIRHAFLEHDVPSIIIHSRQCSSMSCVTVMSIHLSLLNPLHLHCAFPCILGFLFGKSRLPNEFTCSESDSKGWRSPEASAVTSCYLEFCSYCNNSSFPRGESQPVTLKWLFHWQRFAWKKVF